VKTPTPFPFEIGHGVIERVSKRLPDFVAFVAPEPWEIAESRFAHEPKRVVEALQVDHEYLTGLAGSISGVEAVVGLGGGSSLDTAKFVAWKRGLPLWQFPSIVSVDAVFTQPIGVREDHRVRYVGSAVPQMVAADLDLLLAAPPGLNRAGVGDILSCRTGLFDWQFAQGDPKAPALDEDLVQLGLRLLGGLSDHAADIAAVNQAGLTFILEAYREEGAVGDAVGHSFFEEGSEHYLAYCLEHMTGRHFVHGELIALGVLAMVVAQDNRVAETAALIGALGVRCLPSELDIPLELLDGVLRALPGYCLEEGFPRSVAGTLTDGRREAVLGQLSEWESKGLPGRPG
jgi:glycerol dehydrogenase-like iron-containing ADH family enzyme